MEENVENVVEETTQPTEQKVDETKFESAGDDSVIKIDLSKPPKTKEDAVPEQSTDEVPVRDESETSEKVLEENVEKTDEKPTGEKVTEEVQNNEPIVEEITEEEVKNRLKNLNNLLI